MKLIGQLIIVLLMFIFAQSIGKTAEFRKRVVIIDTGINTQYIQKEKLCVDGHFATYGLQTNIQDTHGHGTNVAGIIAEGIDVKTQCITIVKGIDPNSNDLVSYMRSLVYLLTLDNIMHINLSLGGLNEEFVEKSILRMLLKKGVTIAAATGNEGNQHMNVKCTYYPVCSFRNVVGFYAVSSNDDLRANNGIGMGFVYERFCGGYPKLCGTSQATAYFTSKLISGKINK
jgi:subtilisin family serine protease